MKEVYLTTTDTDRAEDNTDGRPGKLNQRNSVFSSILVRPEVDVLVILARFFLSSPTSIFFSIIGYPGASPVASRLSSSHTPRVDPTRVKTLVASIGSLQSVNCSPILRDKKST